MIDKQPLEITLLYNSEKADDISAKKFMESLPGYHIKAIDLNEDHITEKGINLLAEKMGVNIEDLLDPAYDDHISVHKEGLTIMSRSELISLMALDSKLVYTPIIIRDNNAFQYSNLKHLVLAGQTTASKGSSMRLK